MESTLRALREHASIELQIIATGTHTHATRGKTLREIRRRGWKVDAVLPWADDTSPAGTVRATGHALVRLTKAFEELRPDVVLVVGDRVEAFAAASAAQIGGRIVAHVHGGDRAMGQVDDALRHAISKLAHVHFAATRESGERLFAMGEDRGRIHVVGAPGVDGIREDALNRDAMIAFADRLKLTAPLGEHAVLLLHPTDSDETSEARRTRMLIDAARRTFGDRIIALLPNNDPGSPAIAAELSRREKRGEIRLLAHVERPAFLGLLRDCRALIGNSSSGIIEAGSFGMPVLDVGPRQQGRERGSNVRHAEWSSASLAAGVRQIARAPHKRTPDNPYERGGRGAGVRIASLLGAITIDTRLRRKVIRY